MSTRKPPLVFSLPGAYAPTCSSIHLPRYNELASKLRANGVDQIVCVSVNDAFVMNEWKQDQEAGNITLLPDGNGEFTAGMGLLVDKSNVGFGKRSWRYSMLVKNGVIEQMFIEPEKEGDVTVTIRESREFQQTVSPTDFIHYAATRRRKSYSLRRSLKNSNKGD